MSLWQQKRATPVKPLAVAKLERQVVMPAGGGVMPRARGLAIQRGFESRPPLPPYRRE